jgi:hypothetical protein
MATQDTATDQPTSTNTTLGTTATDQPTSTNTLGDSRINEFQAELQFSQQRQANKSLEDQMKVALISLRLNAGINTTARVLFYLIATGLLCLVGWMLYRSFDRFVYVMLDVIGRPGAAEQQVSTFLQTLLALSLPLAYATIAAGLCIGAAMAIQYRGVKEFVRSLEQVSRLRREGADSRTRGLTQILEETLANARQAFSLQLWISRALFLVGISLLVAFFVSLALGDTVMSGSSGIGSLAAFVAAAIFNPQKQIGSDLANVTQLEAILGGYIRQASVLEEHLYQVMEQARYAGMPERATQTVKDGVRELTTVLSAAVDSIQDKVEAGDQMSAREQYLFKELFQFQQSMAMDGRAKESNMSGAATGKPTASPLG